jgi:hypothetical protein
LDLGSDPIPGSAIGAIAAFIQTEFKGSSYDSVSLDVGIVTESDRSDAIAVD